MKRISPIPGSFFLGFVLASLNSCGSHQEGVSLETTTLIQWFQFGASARSKPSKSVNPPLARIDSAVSAIRRNALVPGDDTIIGTDASGTAYAIGCRTPDTYRLDSLYPCIIYLHGGIGTRQTDKGARAWSMFEFMLDSLNLFLASPSGNRFVPWWSSTGLERILFTYRLMMLRYPVNPDKVLLAGVSDGAAGCFAAASTIPGPFAGFFAVSGFGGVLRILSFPLQPSNMQSRPIYQINGDRDHLYPIDSVKSFSGFLQNSGIDIELSIHPGQPHGFEYKHRELSALTQRIREWSRPEIASSFSWTFSRDLPNVAGFFTDYALSSSPGNHPYVGEYMNNDSLVLRGEGVASLTFALPSSVVHRAFGVKTAGGLSQNLDVTFTPVHTRLTLLASRGFPASFLDKVVMVRIER